jgi:predicted MFS family arabinose efflux permease
LVVAVVRRLIGANMAFVQQYRFAAVEYVEERFAGRAVATVMLGTLLAALIGPTLGQLVSHWDGWPEFTASYVTLAFLCLGAALVLTRLPTPQRNVVIATRASARSLREIGPANSGFQISRARQGSRRMP